MEGGRFKIIYKALVCSEDIGPRLKGKFFTIREALVWIEVVSEGVREGFVA